MNQARVFLIGGGLPLYAMAYNEWINPLRPQFSGKLSLIYRVLYHAFWPHAIAAFGIVSGTVFVLVGFLKKPNELTSWFLAH